MSRNVIDEMMEHVEILERENRQLKERCFVFCKGALCCFCPMGCKHRPVEFRKDGDKQKNDNNGIN